jgi:hypothetical protein
VDALEVSTGPVEPAAVATATFTIPQGKMAFSCTIHGGMDGVIVGI